MNEISFHQEVTRNKEHSMRLGQGLFAAKGQDDEEDAVKKLR